MLDPAPLSRPELLALTPATAFRPRTDRYHGDAVYASIAALGPDDAEIVRGLYAFLGDVYEALGGLASPKDGLAPLREAMARADYPRLLERLRALGTSLVAANTPLALRKVYHDIRGGSLPGLLLHLDLVEAGEATAQDVERIFILVRDHRKIVRNALPDLDPEGYANDLSPREHDVALIVSKWSDVEYAPGTSDRVRVDVDCTFVGGVSECCMEFAALDRVLYNLINNAARFAADRRVHLAVLPLTDEQVTDLRFVVGNRVTPEHAERLKMDLGGQFDRVFAGGYTTGGHGVGLQICGDIITHGYGLSSLRQALDGGYLGARLVGDQFVVWFHWPARRAA